ncbi:MAG: hypothetical protein KJO35_07405 [Gammaproteobacteria bacterium]|nr:hypothetical protein [Gammaproteobacteria bacterium]
MKRGEINFPDKDLPLREDVSLLGGLVGEMLAEQGGTALFDRVEQVRQTAIARREDSPVSDDLLKLVEGLATPQALELVRHSPLIFRLLIWRSRSIVFGGDGTTCAIMMNHSHAVSTTQSRNCKKPA